MNTIPTRKLLLRQIDKRTEDTKYITKTEGRTEKLFRENEGKFILVDGGCFKPDHKIPCFIGLRVFSFFFPFVCFLMMHDRIFVLNELERKEKAFQF